METARLHWEILQRVPDELANKVRAFMVIGDRGDGVMLVTKDGRGYWLGEMRFGEELEQAMKPIRLDIPKLASMAHGEDHILLLDEEGHIHAIGQNDCGQLGLGTVDYDTHFSPQLISSPHKFTSVRCGYVHSLAMTENGRVWAWGDNSRGQVCDIFFIDDPYPSLHQISELNPHRVVAIECGAFHSLALTDQGDVYAWGSNECRQLGNENFISDDWNKLERLGKNKRSDKKAKIVQNVSVMHRQYPTRIPTPIPIKSIVAGHSHTLLLTQTGEVYAFGDNGSCQLGLPNATKSSASLVKVDGLPVISQIASHFDTHVSIAITAEQECFVWGLLGNNLFTSTPFKLPLIYSTPDSVLSFRSISRNTSHSVRIEGLKYMKTIDSNTQTELSQFPSNPVPGEECHKIDSTESGSIRMGDRVCKMFDNPDSNPDVIFKLGDHSILAHRNLLQISSGYFNRFFSESSSSSNFNQPSPNPNFNPLLDATNPSEPVSQITTIPIPDHSYPTFHAYLHFLYTGTLQVPTEHLVELFELAHSHLESDLSELCLERMRSTISPENCCIYYQLTERHSLPEFQQELVQFISNNILQVFPTTAYQSMDGDLCKKLAISIANLRQ